MQSLFRILMFR